MRLTYPLPLLSRMLGVSCSGYYSWIDRPLSQRAQEEIRLELEIKAAHLRTRQTYGPERLQGDLAENGIQVGICRIRRIRKKLGLRCKQKKKFKATTDSRHKRENSHLYRSIFTRSKMVMLTKSPELRYISRWSELYFPSLRLSPTSGERADVTGAVGDYSGRRLQSKVLHEVNVY